MAIQPARLLVDGRTAVAFTGTAASLPVMLAEGDPAAALRDNTAELQLYYGERVRLLVLPRPRATTDGLRVVVNGREELRIVAEDREEMLVPERGLADFGGDPALEATVFSASGQPRCIVIRGTRLEYSPGHVEVNGATIPGPPALDSPRFTTAPRRLAAGEYFLLADARRRAGDAGRWGVVPRSHLIGRAVLRYYPPSRFGLLP